MKILLIYILLAITTSIFASVEIAPFQTDFCTDFPEGTIREPNLWRDCCIKHDISYWVAGTKKQQSQADWRLHQCVQNIAGKFYAALIYRGVRIGHLSPIKSKTRWGWAWKQRAYFQVLSTKELHIALDELEQSDISPQLIQEFIQEAGLSRQ